MKTVVSNSSPICCLVLIGEIHMLDLLVAVEKLRLTSFRASPHLLKTILDRHHTF